MVFEAGHSGKTQVIRLWRLWILSLSSRYLSFDATESMNRCMPQDEATDGKMTLGLDISSDLKHERWSFNLSLLKRWTQQNAGHAGDFVISMFGWLLLSVYNLFFCRFPRVDIFSLQATEVLYWDHRCSTWPWVRVFTSTGSRPDTAICKKVLKPPWFKVWNITKSVDFQFCTFKLACSCPIGAFAWLWCYCIVAPFKPQLLKQFFLCPRPFDKKPWAKKLAPWRMLHYLNPVQRLNGNGVTIWRHSSAATHNCVKFGSLERLT